MKSYNVLNKEIVDESRQAKENWLNEKENDKEIKNLEKQHKMKEMYDKVKKIKNKCSQKGGRSITDKNGKYYLIKKKLLRDGLNI